MIENLLRRNVFSFFSERNRSQSWHHKSHCTSSLDFAQWQSSLIYTPTLWKCSTSFGLIPKNLKWNIDQIETNLWTHKLCFPTFYLAKVDDHQTSKSLSNNQFFYSITHFVPSNFSYRKVNLFICSDLKWTFYMQ